MFDNDEARGLCKHFYVADLEDENWAPVERNFDTVLFADVIEHLRNTSIVSRSRDWLRPGGKIVASTGNIALWFMRLALLSGRFRYAPRGILDETHVHLYTEETFRELIESSGFKILHQSTTPIPVEKLSVETFPIKHMVQAGDWFQTLMARFWPGLFAYQFIIEAIPRDEIAQPIGVAR